VNPHILFYSRNELQTGFRLSKSRLNSIRTILKLEDPFAETTPMMSLILIARRLIVKNTNEQLCIRCAGYGSNDNGAHIHGQLVIV